MRKGTPPRKYAARGYVLTARREPAEKPGNNRGGVRKRATHSAGVPASPVSPSLSGQSRPQVRPCQSAITPICLSMAISWPVVAAAVARLHNHLHGSSQHERRSRGAGPHVRST